MYVIYICVQSSRMRPSSRLRVLPTRRIVEYACTDAVYLLSVEQCQALCDDFLMDCFMLFNFIPSFYARAFTRFIIQRSFCIVGFIYFLIIILHLNVSFIRIYINFTSNYCTQPLRLKNKPT